MGPKCAVQDPKRRSHKRKMLILCACITWDESGRQSFGDYTSYAKDLLIDHKFSLLIKDTNIFPKWVGNDQETSHGFFSVNSQWNIWKLCMF